MPVNTAIELLNGLGVKQPMIFKLQEKTFVKVDNNVILIADFDSFADAVAFVVATFYVFNLAYPEDLRFVYTFLEKALGIPETMQSTSVKDFCRQLNSQN